MSKILREVQGDFVADRREGRANRLHSIIPLSLVAATAAGLLLGIALDEDAPLRSSGKRVSSAPVHPSNRSIDRVFSLTASDGLFVVTNTGEKIAADGIDAELARFSDSCRDEGFRPVLTLTRDPQVAFENLATVVAAAQRLGFAEVFLRSSEREHAK